MTKGGSKGQPLRVLRLIARLNVGGPSKHVAWLMSGLDPQRFEQTLAAGRVAPGEDDLGPWLKGQGVDWVDLPRLGREITPISDAVCLMQVVRLMMRVRPHIVATHTAKAGFLGRAALLLYRPYARLRGWPVPRAVHTFHGHTFRGYFTPAKEKFFLGLERFLAKRATWRIVAISPRMRSEVCDEFKVGAPKQFALVPLGIDLEPFAHPGPGRAEFRAELEAGDDEVLIGAVGRVAPVKNYALFVQIAAELKKTRPELYAKSRFVLIGGGPKEQLQELRQLCRELGVEDRVTLLGNRSDPEKFFPGLDMLLITSLNEGTPVAILEGGACGLPVAATAVGGVPDLLGPADGEPSGSVTPRRRGLTVASGDAPALVRAVALLLDDPSQARALGAELRSYVHAAHGKDRLVADIAALYDEARPG